ncbi:putative OsmC-like protein [Solirubrobacter pauli]|uniref:Putative OsmC-like protein n=1 Tax=Solirubrobacter pauli TaxID=166793 RepID=A0A660L959_9ACTN|nr:OsmC family protein [Solirubrobacter pauli]RKQ90443.1 putative OsmC-like protein [Solirubrobacter pauli]
MSTTESAADNGVNTQALLDARAALSDAPEAAEFTWRATNEWLRGTHSRTTIQQYSGLGQDHNHKSTFEYDADHPEVFAAEDQAPTPVEFLLVGLSSCLTAGVAAVAQNRGIQLNSVKATVEGDMNILGILGADPEVRNGYNSIRVNFEIDADADADEVAALVAQSQKRSAVFDALTNPTNITVTVN